MPKRRTVLQSNPTCVIERVESLASTTQEARWSAVYQVATLRFVLPHSGVTEFRWGDGDGGDGSAALLDGISVLCLPMGVSYQMQQMPSCRGDAHSNIVISLPADSGVAVTEPRVGALSARAQWQLRRYWCSLARRTQAEPVLPVQTILGLAYRVPTSGSASAALRIHRVKRDIAQRVASLDTPCWTLNDVADAAGLSPFHLARIFKAHTGMTLHAYRQQLRLAMALQCLQSGMCNLADLAASLGYSSQSHMGFAFQRGLGVTPAQARSQLAD
jgi:AraC-like DNA-binding protein